ncbi:hypothetical protein EYM_06040 [Ignicoccus islandicus DSM 13165]|uniref:ABC transmembrane type-1 domain-containing protein n=1 Tax=Ignicoccus islandicus DSM 13165 TaxID=940295 RepID=A0A0U3F9D5_9CREN|nr:ABC transporter permease subunit [Ignicoccus islandicus]ALU12648.1 hypothetical protein EYM_06040 [Ignicoccus islandicus DSM 13165]
MECVEVEPLASPSPAFPLGGDPLGRDALCVFLSLLPNTLTAQVAAIATSFAFLWILVLLAASSKIRRIERSSLSLANGFPKLPFFVFLSLVVSLTPLQIGALVGILGSIRYAIGLLERAEEIMNECFSVASLSSGGTKIWVVRKHVLPHLIGLILRSSLIVGAIAVHAEVGLGMMGLEDVRHQGIGQLVYLVLNTPGAIQTQAGLIQALFVTSFSTFLSAVPMILRASLPSIRDRKRYLK